MTDEKNELRRAMKSLRHELFRNPQEKAEADKKIFTGIINSQLFIEASTVLSFVSFGDEPDTMELIKYSIAHNKRTAVPRCEKHGIMNFFYIDDPDKLKKSSYGIPEPDYDESRLAADTQYAVCIVPALSFDSRGYRIGYGGGFYDRYLSRSDMTGRIGICYSRLLCDAVPAQDHDIRVNTIITEKGTINING
ncbi:MAG: 5-formyltetrahydrofolate cyclo-ligase [Oscillospiraceae bacterium]|nr:5-formyltetrahydrofolate cyclo-ligase [Oscillospiraceae bacterium]